MVPKLPLPKRKEKTFFETATGCLKKNEFYQIEHLEILLPVGKKYL